MKVRVCKCCKQEYDIDNCHCRGWCNVCGKCEEHCRHKRRFVRCDFCKQPADANTAHLHHGKWVGDACCWEERLRISE